MALNPNPNQDPKNPFAIAGKAGATPVASPVVGPVASPVVGPIPAPAKETTARSSIWKSQPWPSRCGFYLFIFIFIYYLL